MILAATRRRVTIPFFCLVRFIHYFINISRHEDNAIVPLLLKIAYSFRLVLLFYFNIYKILKWMKTTIFSDCGLCHGLCCAPGFQGNITEQTWSEGNALHYHSVNKYETILSGLFTEDVWTLKQKHFDFLNVCWYFGFEGFQKAYDTVVVLRLYDFMMSVCLHNVYTYTHNHETMTDMLNIIENIAIESFEEIKKFN